MNIPKTVIIPKNLSECFVQLDTMLTAEELGEFMNGTEDDICMYHHGLGQWLRNNWGLWQGGVLYDYFKDMGIWHADDMSGIILRSFYRFLNQIKIDLDEQIKFYKDFWEKQNVGPQ